MNPCLLQIVGSKKKLGFGNDTDLRGFYESGLRYERHSAYEYKSELCDLDAWNLKYSLKQITQGLNSCPLLYSCFFGSDWLVRHDELINNRDKLRSQKLVSGALRFCDRKITTSKRNRKKHHAGKYIYYALTDLVEAMEIMRTKDCVYPLRLTNEQHKLIQALKSNDGGENEGYAWYEELRHSASLIRVNERVDFEFVNHIIDGIKSR